MRAEIVLNVVILHSLQLLAYGNPVVNPGLFVMEGIATCGESSGLCLLGVSCKQGNSLESDEDGHCNGLERAFPNAKFVCCRHSQEATTTLLELTNKLASLHHYEESDVKENYIIRIHNLPSATDPSNTEATTEENVEITGITVINNEDDSTDTTYIIHNDKSSLNYI